MFELNIRIQNALIISGHQVKCESKQILEERYVGLNSPKKYEGVRTGDKTLTVLGTAPTPFKIP